MSAFEATGDPESVAPSVTDPALIAVKVEVKVPLGCAAAGVRVPVPPTMLEVNWTDPAPGSPVGFRLPKASLGVRVTETV
jgi:hypothetical protein